MAILSYDKIVEPESTSLNRVQDGIFGVVDTINNQLLPWVNGGVLLTGVSLVAGANTVNHTLGRIPLGWTALGVKTTGAYPVEAPAPVSDPALSLELVATAVTTLSIWVF